MPPMLPAFSPIATATSCLPQPCFAQLDDAGKGAGPPLVTQILPLVAIAIVAYFMLFRPERERVRRQQELLSGLKKNDRVLTASGIYGTVANVERDADRVTLKVDDAANVRITVTISSIAKVLRDGAESATPAGDS
jgi:preprotein translocase subunit YajC